MAEEGNLDGLELSFKKKKEKRNEKLRGAMPHPVCSWPAVRVRLGPGSPEGDWRWVSPPHWLREPSELAGPGYKILAPVAAVLPSAER